jgi:hypothetical protein
MYYFDRDYLKQYLDAEADLKVFADQEWYGIPDESDLATDKYLVAYDGNGKPHTIDYKEITQIKAYDNVIDLETLQDKIYNQPDPNSDSGENTPDKNSDQEAPDLSKIQAAPDMKGQGDQGDNKEPIPDDEKQKEKPNEAMNRIIKNMITESTELGNITKGDFVENLNKESENYNTKGVVTGVFANRVDYRVYKGGNITIVSEKYEMLKKL